MRSYLVALFCLFSATLFSQNPGVTVQIDIFNAPQEPVFASVDFIGSSETESYTILVNQGIFSTFYFDPQISWNQGLVHIEDCNGDSLFDSFANIDSTDFYYTSFFYCESDSIFGCTDPTALNFNSFANIDDGSCIYNGPENDLCSGAQPLEPGTILIDNSFATQNEGIFGECWNFGSGEGEQSSLWFSFTTPATPAQISIEAIADGTWTLTDTQFGLFTECGGEMIYCDGNSGEGLLSAFEFSCGQLDTNATYILMVDGWNGDAGTCFLEYEVTNPCAQPVFGCTDPSAANYNPDATTDDGSCTYDCTEIYLWFDFLNEAPQDTSFMFWNIVNEFGEVIEEGFFDNWGQQYDLCIGDGCYSLNIYDISPDWEGIYNLYVAGGQEYFGVFNGSNEFISVEFGVNSPDCGDPIEIEGCTDPAALNYNPLATIDDDSCEYFECDDNEVNIQITTQNWGYEISWNIRNEAGAEVAGSGDYPNYSTITELACLEDGCYTFELFDSFGDGWNDGTFELILDGTTLASGTLEDGEFGSVPFGVNTEGCGDPQEVLGCTDPEALNYNPDATEDDGSCEYFECDNNEVIIQINTENWGYEISWIIRNETGDAVAESGSYENYSTYLELFCLEDGCYTFELYDSFGDGWNGGDYAIIVNGQDVINGTLLNGFEGQENFGVNAEGCEEEEGIFGCTDPLAINFNPNATIDDGTCQYECTSTIIGFDFQGGFPQDSAFYSMTWSLTNQWTGEAYDGWFYDSAMQLDFCLSDGCYEFTIFGIPDEWSSIYAVIAGNQSLAFGEFDGSSDTYTFSFGINAEGCGETEIEGCTDPEALNYNPEATIDDGSCEYDFECGISFEVIADSTGGNMFYIIPSDNIINASSVLWDFGDGSTSSEFYPTHIYESDGPFTLCLFVTFEDDSGNFCEISYCEILDGATFGSGFLSGGFMINVIQPGALSDNLSLAEKELSVYPNPTNDITTVSFRSDQSDKLTLRVTDLTGKVIEEKILSSSVGQQKMQVDLSEFPQGLYLIGLEQSGSRSYAKVVRR